MDVPPEVTVGKVTVSLGISQDGNGLQSVRCTFGLKGQGLGPDRDYMFEFLHTDFGGVDMTVDGEYLQTLVPGSKARVVFGNRRLNATLAGGRMPTSSDTFTFTDDGPGLPNPRLLTLDNAYQGLVPSGWVAIVRAGKKPVVTQIVSATDISQTAYNMSGNVTQLRLADDWLDKDDQMLSDIRKTVVYAAQ